MHKLLLGTSVVFLCICLSYANAQAHVLIKSDDASASAILHVSPDDDPIAGKTATLFFDIQGVSALKNSYDVQLSATDETYTNIVSRTTMRDGGVLATLTFPAQGLYRLQLELRQKESPFATTTFTHSQRVARGAGATPPVQHAWADSLRLLSVILLISLGIAAFNNRENILLRSKF